ncbi:MAG: signal peptide peptidase SppA [Xanthomonadales bacterium]|nr:signal peptide peptidase SppA [Xanthomonadales bacterium]
MTAERSSIARFFSGVWRFINGARIVFLNLVFFLIVFMILGALLSSGESLVIQSKTALLVKPSGRVVEEYTGTPLDHALQKATEGQIQETRLRDILGAIRKAKDDTRISVLVIDPSRMWGIGLAALHEIEGAVRDFRESGKPVIALGDVLGQHQYYLAALADEVWLNPEGLVWLDGYAVYRQYYREALEKLSVEVNLYRVGEYKSAGEPWVRDDMSPEAREANLYWLGGLWQQYLEGISRHRGLPLEELRSAVEQYADRLDEVDGDFAALAQALGLVDELIETSAAYQRLATMSAPEHDGSGFRQVDVDNYLLATSLETVEKRGDRVAVVVAQGEIVHGHMERGYIASETTAQRIRKLARRSEVSAVVIRIDSPGGDAFASEKIRSELQALRDAGKTVVISMGNVAASGGYWISMAADEVWASPASITGSIGVYGLAPRVHQSLERIGVRTDGVGTTPLSGQFDISRPMAPELEKIYRSTVARTYEEFIEIVSQARNMPPEAVREVAQGRVWSGSQAQERGLVDHTGSLQDAIDAAGRIAGLGTDFVTEYEEAELSALELFLLDLAGDVMAHTPLATQWRMSLPGKILGSFQRDIEFLSRTTGQFNVTSHCWCRIE